MAHTVTIHFDNLIGFEKPTLLLQREDAAPIAPTSNDSFGHTFTVEVDPAAPLIFKFGDAANSTPESDSLWRSIQPAHLTAQHTFWCRSWHPFVYIVEPQAIDSLHASAVVEQYTFVDGAFISDSGGRFALGASRTTDGGVLFGLYHPHAAQVYVVGDFNHWQHPHAENADSAQFLPMRLHKGFFDVPNVWLLKVDDVQVGQAYKFYVVYGALAAEGVLEDRLMVDPYARFLSDDYERNDSVIVDPSAYQWHDGAYQTPLMHDLIIYELHVHGFTHDRADITPEHRGKYTAIIDRIESGYFDQLGITCLYLMPISEVPTPQGRDALGYNTSLFMAVERDFGTPDELRQLVDVAHQHGLAVIIDQVFNHSANSWNPLWKFILDHPNEIADGGEGGLYFSGASPWGNRVSTERTETQNMLIDACKVMLVEYHLDGFRFDATHTNYMDHGFLHRLADELQALKPDVILIAENLPNQAELNRQGFNGFGQWNDYFHDAMKAFLREAKFEGTDDHPHGLGDIFYFSKAKFAAHTNNVINYCESHDEHSVPHEVGFVAELNTPPAKERKARLGMFATMVALGQPMIYMGQEFGVERERNIVYFDFPEDLMAHGFYQWASRLIRLRRRYPALRLHGFNPIEDGQFHWLLGAWLDARCGAGKRVIGWRSTPTDDPNEHLVVMLNFENHPVSVDIHLGTPGRWVRLASIDMVNDIAPEGTNDPTADTTLHTTDGVFRDFVLPDSSGFIYKWMPEG